MEVVNVVIVEFCNIEIFFSFDVRGVDGDGRYV